jgi:glycosyltransferase involved in cell wall biosynthesis
MRLRVVSTLTSGRISGVDVFAMHLTEGLAKRGVDARLLFTNPDRVEIDRMPLPPSATAEQLPEESRGKRRRRRRALREYLTAIAPCIYLPNYDYDHSPVCASLPDSVATIGIVHSDDPMHYDHVRVLGRFWNAVVGVSSHTTRAAANLFPRPDRVFRIPYGVPVLPSFTPRADRKPGEIRLLYVGRLEQSQKRVLDMVELLDRLVRRRVPARLTLVGDGPARSKIEESGRRHVESGALRLLGTRRNDEMPEMYLDADVFLLTSAFEGLPVSLLEAMAFGCVPLATNVKSGVPELVQEGVNGLLVDVGDVEAMADRIERLQREPAEIERMGEAARRSMEAGEHSLDRMVDRYLELFAVVESDLRRGKFRRPRPFPGELAYRRLQCRVGRNIRRLQARP